MNYLKIYEKLIEAHGTKEKPEGLYTENHHIIPVCLGGEDSEDNKVYLTARCHLLAHWLLARAHPYSYKLTHAFSMMCLMKNSKMERKRPPLHILAEARRRKAQAQSNKLKCSNLQFLSDESKQKRIKTAIKNGSYKGRKNSKANPVDVYDYFTGKLVAKDIILSEWFEENGIIRNLNATLYADRSKRSSSKNRHYAKGLYIVNTGDQPYPPAGGEYSGPYSNQGHIGLKKKRKSK